MKYDYIIIIAREGKVLESLSIVSTSLPRIIQGCSHLEDIYFQEHILVHLLMELVTLSKEYS